MYTCMYCNKQYEKQLSYANHQCRCPKNPNRALPKNYRVRNDIEEKLDDDGKLYNKWLNKRNNAKKEGIECLLSYYEFCLLVQQANIKSSDLGFSGNYYVLARFNDTGPYSYNNCRFILQSENAKERVVSDKARSSSSNNAKKMNERNKLMDPQVRSEKIRSGQQASKKWQTYRDSRRNISKQEHVVDITNSQYGSFWITDGSNNMKWRESKGELPPNYYRGRTCK